MDKKPNPSNNPTQNSTNKEKSKTNKKVRREGMQVSDFIVGLLYVVVSFIILVAIGIYYWKSHGSSLEGFTFWEEDNNKWIEIIFWAFFASTAHNTGYAAYKISKRDFQKRDALLYFARVIEAPFISLALIFVIFNFGISFGDTTISLKDVPISVAIAFTIVTSFFAWDTKDALEEVAKGFTQRLRKQFGVEKDLKESKESKP